LNLADNLAAMKAGHEQNNKFVNCEKYTIHFGGDTVVIFSLCKT